VPRMEPQPIIGLNAHLVSNIPGCRSTGISTYMRHMVEHLPAASPDLDYRVFGSFQSFSSKRLVTVRPGFPTSHPIARILWEQLFQAAQATRHKVRLFHGMAYALPFHLQMPCVLTLYDLAPFLQPDCLRSPKKNYLRWIILRSVRRASRVCVLTDHTRKELVGHLGIPEARVCVIPPACRDGFAPPAESSVVEFRTKRGLPPRFVLAVGRLDRRKNLPLLVRAFARCRGRGMNHHLVIVGPSGWDSQAVFREVERCGLTRFVHFPGFVPTHDLPLWYASSEFLVCCSKYEGFGLPVLEAMACGCPVLCGARGSLPEVVGEAGWLCADDEAVLTESVCALAANEQERGRLRLRGLERAASFSWPRSAALQADVYRDVLESPPEGRIPVNRPASTAGFNRSC